MLYHNVLRHYFDFNPLMLDNTFYNQKGLL